MIVVLPICSNKHSPLYHFVNSLDWDLVIRFSPLRPLVGIKATSLSYKKRIEHMKLNTTLFLFFLFGCAQACGILVSQPRIEPMSPALEARSSNHQTAREFPIQHYF